MEPFSPIANAVSASGAEGTGRALTYRSAVHGYAVFSEHSQHNDTESNFEYIIPPTVQDCQKTNEIFNETMYYLDQKRDEIRCILKECTTTQLIKERTGGNASSDTAGKPAHKDTGYVSPDNCAAEISAAADAEKKLF